MKKTVGQRLREAREAIGISIDDAARETHIRLNYLQELETDHPEQLHSAAQARGFLRLYADFLNLPYDELVEVAQGAEEVIKEERKTSAFDKLPFKPKWIKNGLAEKASRKEEAEIESSPESQPVPESLAATEPQSETAIEMNTEDTGQQPEILAEDEESETLQVEPLESDLEESEVLAEVDEPLTKQNPILEKAADFFSSLTSKLSDIPFLKRILKLEDKPAPMEVGGKKAKQRPQTSEDIFGKIGRLMQSRRKMMELSLSDIENFTNLKRAFLVSIEEGRFSELPSTVQGRGMLNNYAQFLGMEETEVLDLYGQALQLQREERLKPQRKTASAPLIVKVNLPEKWRKILNPDLIIGGVLIVGLFVFIIWGATQVFSAAASEPTEAPSISEVLQITATIPATQMVDAEEVETVEATAIPGVVVVEPTPTVVATVNAAPLQLYILAHDRAYLKVIVDGEEAFVGRVSPNNVYTYSGNESINLLTGNAAGLEVYFNQEYLGSMGSVGEVVDVDFTLAGLITPTPESTRTPTPEIDLGTDAETGDEAMMETMQPEDETGELPAE